MTTREEILSRIRTALPGDPIEPAASHAAIPRLYDRVGTLSVQGRVELFIDRLLDYDTEIIQVETEQEIPSAISQALAQINQQGLLAPADFPQPWLPEHISIARDHNLSTQEVDRAATVITTCEVAIASTGTIILIHAGSQGRRVLTLLPDHHVCLVRRSQVVELVPEALAAIASQSTRPITTISGPSATSDIEMTRIRGVHGPRHLTVILYGG